MKLQVANLLRTLASEEEKTSRLTEKNARNEARCTELQQTLDEERSVHQQTEECIRRMETELNKTRLQVEELQQQQESQLRTLTLEEEKTSHLTELNAENEARYTELQQTFDRERSFRLQAEESNLGMKTELINVNAQDGDKAGMSHVKLGLKGERSRRKGGEGRKDSVGEGTKPY
ncbi:unnamed protein product [Darwinula stevensoni]|uniref:Uncharacterized protein n=1 Tax=Darwinula stevensoni TaxID=69355 RepID=A0A7R9FPI9_9CRUS|nr:unnamed protein product [Darwinula stevensoni]CAG0898081.1 unnamed protein product [Darwinula stevensoni]